MKETTPDAMPPCLQKWCHRFDDVFSHQAQKKGLDTIWGDYWVLCERKNLTQMSNNAVGVVYHQLHYFLTEATWDAASANEGGLEVMQQSNQSLIKGGFTLIRDDSRHRKSSKKTVGVGRQYIGEIGETNNRIVVGTTHLYDGLTSLPLNIKLYQHARTLTKGKVDAEFRKKADISLKLVEKCLERG